MAPEPAAPLPWYQHQLLGDRLGQVSQIPKEDDQVRMEVDEMRVNLLLASALLAFEYAANLEAAEEQFYRRRRCKKDE